MKQSSFIACSAKYFLLASVAMIVMIMGSTAGATTIITDNLERYDGVSCNKLMAVYKRAYISVGFKFSSTETVSAFIFLMSFTFPNPTEPKKPSGGGAFMFNLPENQELSCEVANYTLGVLGHYEAYTLEQHIAFEKLILAANDKAQSLIAKRVGAPKLVRK